MPHELSPEAAEAAIAEYSDEVPLICLTISGPGLETLRLVRNTEPLERASGTYWPWAFDVVIPKDEPRSDGRAPLRLDNTDDLPEELEDYDGVPTVTMEVVLASSPDRVQRGPFVFSGLTDSRDEADVNLELGHDQDSANQQVPAQRYNPSNSPSLFA